MRDYNGFLDQLAQLEDNLTRSDIIELVQKLLQEGKSDLFVRSLVKATREDYTEETIENIICQARTPLIRQYRIDKAYIIALHLQRYTQHIEKLFTQKIVGNEKRIRAVRINNYMNMLELMRAKEKLFGLHRKTFQVVINRLKQSKETKKKSISLVNIDSLTFDEQLELLHLLQKCKRTEVELEGIKRKEESESLIEDIAHEDVGSNISQVIDKINEIKTPAGDLSEVLAAMKSTQETVIRTLFGNE